MRKFKFLTIVATVITVLSSCMGKDYADTPIGGKERYYGSNELKETNVLTIAQLKQKYTNPISTRNGYEKIVDDIQLKGIVTSSDKEGNVYNEIALQDKTGAIIISLGQSAIYGYLPIGTEILVSLKDLYIGNYGLQPQIGVPSVSSKGTVSIGRISKLAWDKHYKIISINNKVEAEAFDINKWNINDDAGKLGVIKNVILKSGYDYNSKSNIQTYANRKSGAGSVSWSLAGIDDKKLVMYNSNFAKFAGVEVPKGKVNITGIFKRFNDQWEIIIRSLSDVENATVIDPLVGLVGKGKGTKAEPFDVTRALALIQSGNAGDKEWYIKGIISTVPSNSFYAKAGSCTYFISDDGKSNTELKVFGGLNLDGAKFSSSETLVVGKQVVVCGMLINYKGTKEIDKNNRLISIK